MLSNDIIIIIVQLCIYFLFDFIVQGTRVQVFSSNARARIIDHELSYK
jgi:hypothetical protein